MATASKNQHRNARARIAAQRAAAARRQRRRKLITAVSSAVAVVAIVVALVAVKTFGAPAKASVTPAQSLPGVARSITTVPASTLAAVGTGTAAALEPVRGKPPALTEDGKPEVLFMSAEYCPYCAAQRWALTVALSRFGTFSGLHFIHSSSTDVFPSTPTLSFYHSRYTSKYLAFTPVEWYNQAGKPLQNPTAAQRALFTTYDAPPYVSQANSLGLPFLDIGNREILTGAQFLPTAMHGMTWTQVAAAMRDPHSAVAKDILGAANVITASLCQLTGAHPAGVCTASGATS